MISSFQGEYFFLSNFSPYHVIYDDMEYPTVEHAYQAAKTLDKELRIAISNLRTPGAAKRFGQGLVLRPSWPTQKLLVMDVLVRRKFRPRSLLAHILLATGSKEIIEGNQWGDQFWGAVLIQGVWQGQNHLGKLLMQIREDLKNPHYTVSMLDGGSDN